MLSHSSRVWLFATLWTVGASDHGVLQARILEQVAMLSSRGSSPLPHPGIKPEFLAYPALVGGFFITEPPGKPHLPSCLISNTFDAWVHIYEVAEWSHGYGLWPRNGARLDVSFYSSVYFYYCLWFIRTMFQPVVQWHCSCTWKLLQILGSML